MARSGISLSSHETANATMMKPRLTTKTSVMASASDMRQQFDALAERIDAPGGARKRLLDAHAPPGVDEQLRVLERLAHRRREHARCAVRAPHAARRGRRWSQDGDAGRCPDLAEELRRRRDDADDALLDAFWTAMT